MDDNNRNFILAIVLSMVVLFAWQMFFGLPKQQEVEAEKQAQQQPTAKTKKKEPAKKPAKKE